MRVEIWSDIVCPWCYIGKRRFEKGLEAFSHRDDVEVVWRSYQLDPSGTNEHGESVDAMLARRKGISIERARQMNEHVSAIAAEDGLEYRLENAQWGNTLDAHRITHLAKRHGLQGEAEERLMRAYFTEALPIADHETLVSLASEIGIDPNEALAMLAGDELADDVGSDVRRGAMFGIQGVPYFVIDERYGVSGAQPPEVFTDVLEQAWRASHPLVTIATADDANACGDDGCEIPPAD